MHDRIVLNANVSMALSDIAHSFVYSFNSILLFIVYYLFIFRYGQI